MKISAVGSFGLLVACAATACGASEQTPVARDEALPQLAVIPDEDPAADVVQVSIEATPALKKYGTAPATSVWTYNGTVPGPLIEANVGDELVVQFRNHLPEATTIHWHGVRLPAAMDGTLAAQDPIEPGESFEYRFTLRDEGLFWFHPHVRSDVQVEKGLYGVIRVRGSAEPIVDEEHILVLDDVNLLADGSLPTYLDDESKMLGRQGNVLLVNGKPVPTLAVQSGALVRFRLVNVANGRFFNLKLPGYTWRVIGTDGGLVPQPYDTEELLLSPGERYDVALVIDGAPGEKLTLMNEPYDRGHDTGSAPPAPVATLVISDEPPLSDRALPDSGPSLDEFEDGPTDHTLSLGEEYRDGELFFTINGAAYPDVPLLTSPTSVVQRFEVENATEMDHPFHLHGAFFQVLSNDGVATPAERLANKDTVIVPQKTTLKLAARFDEPGGWMYHCHILEHAEGGMMGEVMVEAEP